VLPVGEIDLHDSSCGTFSKSPAGSKRLPILIAFPDFPIQKRKRKPPARLLDVRINDGLHFHGIMLVNIDSRLKVRLDMHVGEHYQRYVRPGDALKRIHIQPIADPTAKPATGYALKSLKWRIPDTDRIFIRPKALSELRVKNKG
jgi:hypothetical protein